MWNRFLVGGVWDYKFKCINPVDYEAIILFKIKSAFMRKSLELSLKKHNKDLYEKIKKRPEILEYSFYVPKEYMNTMRTAAIHIIKELNKIVGKDGIKIVAHYLNVAEYIKKKDVEHWQVRFKITGQYIKKQ